MNTDSVWKQAARYGDADTEEHGIEPAIRKQGIDFDAFKYLADQRALRVVLMARPGFDPSALDRPFPVQLDPLEQAAHIRFMSCYWDGLYIGWRARGLADVEEENVTITLSREEAAAMAGDLSRASADAVADVDDQDRQGIASDLNRILEVFNEALA